MAKINYLRDKIDRIDDQLLKLVNRRARLAIKIGEEKSRSGKGKHFHVPHREREIIERLLKLNEGPFPKSSMEAVFREIFSATLALEKPLKIAYLGPEATFTHQASVKQFGRSSNLMPQPTIDTVFREVEQGRADYGVVPVENSIEGSVNHTLDCLVDTSLVICDEMKMEISLYLISKLNDPKKIKKIYSHPQPLAQSRGWLNQNLPRTEHFETSSTAHAALLALEKPHSAAVAAKLAAEYYKLNILAEKIETHAENFTRFLVVTKDSAKKAKSNKTSLIFSIKDESGELLKNLQDFARNNINLSKIQSRPLPQRPWEYLFFVDCDGHIEDKGVAKVISSIRKRSLFLKILGSYPKKV